MPAKIMPGRSKKAIGTIGKNNIIKTTKISESTTAKIKTDGINITMTTAMIIIAKYAAIYPPMPVTCLPFIVIVVVPVKKWITDTSSNMPITINRIFFFFIPFPVPVVAIPKTNHNKVLIPAYYVPLHFRIASAVQ